MPDNPVVGDLIKHATKALNAQDALKTAMQAVSAEVQAAAPDAAVKAPGK